MGSSAEFVGKCAVILVEKRRDGKLCKAVPGERPGVSDVRSAQGGLFGVWGAGGGDGMGVGEGLPTRAYAWFPARRAQWLSWKETAQGVTPQKHPPS